MKFKGKYASFQDLFMKTRIMYGVIPPTECDFNSLMCDHLFSLLCAVLFLLIKFFLFDFFQTWG